jgi:flagellar hook-associated protein 2
MSGCLKSLTEGVMGTVGLSFGSPTSGTGFNVSSTVAEIVSNLQNVETPWKNQLTSLESQDAAISSLGTMFSNLSNDMSHLTNFEGILSQKSGSSSNTNVLQLMSASTSAVAGTHTVVVGSLAQTASGYLAPIASAADKLSGAVTLQVGSGTARTITLNSSDNTLSGLASAINQSGVGISASVLTDASGSRLSLVSGTSGASGNITVSANSLAAAVANTLSYTGTAGTSGANSTGTLSPVLSPSETLSGSMTIAVGAGAPASVTMAAVNSAEGDATLSDLESYINTNSSSLGVTASIVTNSDGTSSLSLESATPGSAGTLTVSSGITDSSTALGYTQAVTGTNARLTVDGVALTSATNTVTNLIPGLTFQLLAPSPDQVQVVIGNDNADVESTVNQFVVDYNSLISALNTQEGRDSSGNAEPLFGSPTLSLLQQQLMSGLNTANPNGYLDAISSTSGATLSGSVTIQVGSGTAQTVNVGDSSTPNTLSGLVSAINSAEIGVTAGIATSNGKSTLTLTSQTSGANGALTVTSAIVSTAPTPMKYSDTTKYTSSTPDIGTLGAVAGASDALSGSLTIQVGSGKAQTITLDSSNNTLSGLMSAINGLSGVSAALDQAGTGLKLTSGANGAAGALTVTSNVVDTTSPTSTALNYNASSDINSLTSLGISVNNDGSLTFDATSLDSLLNNDYSSVMGFFQNANSWGQTFNNMLTNAGSSSATGILSLASRSNSGIESTLNADISREQSQISAEQLSLTNELNQANEILQELPSQLTGIDELYSAITGYNQNH